MNNNGFTLVELIGIILVLAAIFLVSFPTLLNLTKFDKEKEYSTMVKNLCLAGESYISANEDDFSDLSIVGSQINITLDELISYGSVNSNLKNPKTNKNISNDSLIYTVLSDYSLDCKYIDN